MLSILTKYQFYTQACKLIASTSCECPTPDIAEDVKETDTQRAKDECEFEMKYHDFEDNTKVRAYSQ